MKSEKIVWKKYFILKAIHESHVPGLVYLVKKNEIYLSTKVELTSPLEMAHLESRSLAGKFREACIKRFKKRYGDTVDLDVVECSTRENKTIQNRIKADSAKIKQRLAAVNINRDTGVKPSLYLRALT